MWNFGFANMMDGGIPLGSIDVFRISELLIELVVWLFIAACFGVGLSYLRAGVAPLRRKASRQLNVRPKAAKVPSGPDLGAAA